VLLVRLVLLLDVTRRYVLPILCGKECAFVIDIFLGALYVHPDSKRGCLPRGLGLAYLVNPFPIAVPCLPSMRRQFGVIQFFRV
jgi:hypothetical protein